MRLFFWITVAVLLPLFSSANSQDEGLISDHCLWMADSQDQNWSTYPSTDFLGLTCKQIQGLNTKIGVVTSIAIVGAKDLWTDRQFRQQLFPALLSAGAFVTANPAVAVVTVVGIYGVTRMYIALTKSIEECEAADQKALEDRLRSELQTKLQLH